MAPVAIGVLLGAYVFEGANAYEFTSMAPADRIAHVDGDALAAMESAATDVKDATSQFEDDLKGLGKPDTASGDEAPSPPAASPRPWPL